MKHINKINRSGVLVKHSLSNKGKDLGIYTLGPLGANILKKPYTPNWWMSLHNTPVLKQLVANQLLLRMLKTGQDVNYMIAPPLRTCNKRVAENGSPWICVCMLMKVYI